jgi:hypothetical protein
MNTAVRQDIKTVAGRLAEMNAQAEPNIEEIYLFPDQEEIRLIELDSSTISSRQITPFYFAPDPAGGIPYRFGIALIRPEEKDILSPPIQWGNWSDAVPIWKRKPS